MSTPTMGLAGQSAPKAPQPEKGLIPDGLKTSLIFALILTVGYLLYDSYQFQNKSNAEFTRLADELRALDNRHKVSDSKIAGLTGEVSETQQAVGSTKQELQKTTAEIQAEGKRTKAELSQALSTKADSSQVQAQVLAARSDAEAKIGQVSSEVGGVKTEVTTVKTDVNTVKTDLANTRRDLEGTQRQLVDVRETLSAAVARNASELSELRRKGERDYTEFTIPKRNQMTKVEDIRLILTKTDDKKGKYNVKIVVDDSQLEKKDRTLNEPVAFLVGRNRLRYELVVNWVKKDSIGGYISIPKDKALASEHAAK